MKLKMMRTAFLYSALFMIPAVVVFVAELQGFNILDDGLWLLGTQVLADGGTLYRDFFTVYGPMKFYLLLPFFWILGESVRTLVVFKAFIAGSSSIFGFIVARRYGARYYGWLVPLCILAIGSVPPRYFFLSLFAFAFSEMSSRSSRLFINGLLLGLAWGAISLFGLDMLLCGIIVVFMGGTCGRIIAPVAFRPQIRWVYGTLVGFFGVLGFSLLIVAVTGSLTHFIWDTLICPTAFSPHHIGQNFLEGFLSPRGSNTVFSQVFTGENLGPAWPGHSVMRTTGVWTMMILIFATPFLAAKVGRKSVDPRLGPIISLAFAGWVTLLWRSDVAHVLAAFYCTLVPSVCILSNFRISRIPVSAIGTVAIVLATAPFAGERLWLLSQANRPNLVQWERPTAQFYMAKSRVDVLEPLLESLGSDARTPTVGWPAQPGLVFLADRPLATRQVTLLSGSVRDESAVIEDLRASNPTQMIIGRISGLAPGARSMEALAPSVWAFLRSHFFIESQVADGSEGFQVIRSAKKSGIELRDLPLERQIPGTSQLVKNSQTPVLESGMTVGQEFRVGGLDLHGMVFLFSTTGNLPTEFDVEITVEEILTGGRTKQLALFKSLVPLDQRVQLRTLALPDIPRSADKQIVFELSITSDEEHDIRMLWHDPQAENGDSTDYYPDGNALLNGQPVRADLFFISF